MILNEFGLPLAVVIFVSVMATNTLVVYGMTMSYENLRPNSNYVRAALVIGLISIAGATWQGILDRFVSFLFLISALFVPVFAIMIVDYWICAVDGTRRATSSCRAAAPTGTSRE